MSQSEVIGAVLIAGFILWLAINKKLSVYWSLLLGGGGTTGQNTAAGNSAGTGANAPPSLVIPGTTTPGTPGLSVNPFAGLPNSVCNFITGGTPFAKMLGCN